MNLSNALASLASSVGDIQSTILTMSRGLHGEDKEGDDREEIETHGETYRVAWI